jgi:hypothetical protein
MDIKTKNIDTLEHKSSCCGYDFILNCPGGGEYSACPICQHGDYDVDYKNLENVFEKGDSFSYCTKCLVIYGFGCTHAVHGCTFDTYFAKIIDSFEYKGEKYDGMPIFSSIKQLEDNYKDFKFNWICTCPGTLEENMCFEAYYKDPYYYYFTECEDKKSDKINKKRKDKKVEKVEPTYNLTPENSIINFARSYNILRYISVIPSLKYS